jgi:uncharacterized protein DUF1569
MKTLAHPPDTAELHDRLQTLRSEAVPRWGKMSSHQMVCHLGDCFRMALREKPVSPNTGLLQRTVLKWIALYTPLPWPRGIQTRPEIDQLLGGTRPGEFAADLAQVRGLLDAMTERRSDLDGHPHPTFGLMTEADWLRWGYLHVDHHLRQFGV